MIGLVITPSATSTGATTIVYLPLAFVRSGNIQNGGGKANYLGANTRVWSRTSNSSLTAYSLNAYPTIVYEENTVERHYGFPLRCLYELDRQRRGKAK